MPLTAWNYMSGPEGTTNVMTEKSTFLQDCLKMYRQRSGSGHNLQTVEWKIRN